MKIKVTLIGSLSKYMEGNKTKVIEFQESLKAEEILSTLRIPSEYCSFMMVNGLKVSRSHLLKEGDQVVVFPLVSGG